MVSFVLGFHTHAMKRGNQSLFSQPFSAFRSLKKRETCLDIVATQKQTGGSHVHKNVQNFDGSASTLLLDDSTSSFLEPYEVQEVKQEVASLQPSYPRHVEQSKPPLSPTVDACELSTVSTPPPPSHHKPTLCLRNEEDRIRFRMNIGSLPF